MDMSATILRGQTALTEGNRVAEAGARRTPRRVRLSESSYLERVIDAGQVFENALSGSLMAKAKLEEAMTRSDFPLLFADFVGYTLAEAYQNTPRVWPEFAARTTNPDFRPRKILDITGGASILEKVPEGTPYKRGAFAESEFEFAIAKYGKAIAWTFEANIDDNIGAFERAPVAMGRGASNTEDYLATAAVLADNLSGPATWLGTPGTVDLTRGNLETAISTVTTARDSNGAPLSIGAPILMVPRALSLTAANILNTTQINTTTTGVEVQVNGNGLSVTPRLVVNDWLVIDQGVDAAQTWYVLPDPRTSPRPALYMAFLRGREEPDVRVRNDQGTRPGGGDVPVEEGNFDHDLIEYRIRHILGAAPAFTAQGVYVSTGP